MPSTIARVGYFDAGASTGTVDVVVRTGFGRPKCIEFWGGTAAADDTNTDHGRLFYGACDSSETPVQGYASCISADNRVTSATWRRSDTNGIANIDAGNGSQTLLIKVEDRSTWPVDGFRVNVTVAMGSNIRVNYRAWNGGLQVQLDTPTVATSLEVTTGWQPKCAIFFGSGSSITAQSQAAFALGFMSYDGAVINNFCSGVHDLHNVSTTQVNNVSFNNRCYCHVSGPDIQWDCSVTAVSSTSYTLTRQTGVLNAQFFALAMTFEEKALAGHFSTPTSATTASATTNFRPQTVLFSTTRCTSANVVQVSGAVAATGCGVGAFAIDHGQTTQRVADYQTEDNRSTSNTISRISAGTTLRHNNSTAIDSESKFSSVSDTSYTLNFTTAINTSAQLIPYLAVEEGTKSVPFLRVRRPWTERQKRM
jgi:hypothetical protein